MKYYFKNLFYNIRFIFRSSNCEIYKPIFVVGLQGGGLSLITRILRKSGNTVSVSGNSKNFYSPDEMQNEISEYLPEEFRLFDCKYFGKKPFYKGGWMYGTNNFIHHFKKNEDNYTIDSANQFKLLIKNLIKKYASNVNTARFIDKSQTYGLKISLFNKIFGKDNVKFLVLTRNPYITIIKEIKKGALSLQEVNDDGKILLAIEHYLNNMKIMLSDSKKYENVYIMKFEDFLIEPEKWVEEVCYKLELDYNIKMMPQKEDNVKDKWYPIKRGINTDILSSIDGKVIDVINSKLGNLIEELGYEKIEKL